MVRNRGAILWDKAKSIIPGGNQLLSKRAEQFLPDLWPAYYKKAKGCKVQDLDGNWYRDFSIMGIGTCSLGYANDEINSAVIDAIENGSMATLNCYEEVELAEKLLALHSWAGGVRFTRSGGEACSIAVRIARAYTQKDIILFSGYHGWHDWYLATNIGDPRNLEGQLLPGLDPNGVPSQLFETVFPFREGDKKSFDAYIEKYRGRIATVIMEVWRNAEPRLDFLNHVASRCRTEKIVLIFDEISSGFRLTIGGSHEKWGLQPDICILGKALGNGHPIGAVLGRGDVMDAAQSSFISSSYWTERVGFVAGLKTLELFEKHNVVEKLTKTGRAIKTHMSDTLMNSDLNIEIKGVDSVPIIVFGGSDGLLCKTLYTQEMLKRGFLASNVMYLSLAHEARDTDLFLTAFDETVALLSKAQARGYDGYIDGPTCHNGFQRLMSS
ncbi:aminotransferase class III-fold pyridoxal phosphate-dependent enzyme [Alphaproteobacteria bacterium]|nr:aminotransferase class III-fold pyridoxal phosphate-dependent enzyme [Alphaproteobacteria bacterium]